MTARHYVKMIGGTKQFDSDYDILESKLSIKKLVNLQRFGFKLFFFTNGKKVGVHIHAPMRKVKSWFDRGWGWKLGTIPT